MNDVMEALCVLIGKYGQYWIYVEIDVPEWTEHRFYHQN